MDEIPDDLVGLASPDFTCVHCLGTDATLAALEDEDKNTPILTTDSWKDEAGPCSECGKLPSEVVP